MMKSKSSTKTITAIYRLYIIYLQDLSL